ncbi:tRNA lysidine(34) synthetase TilS [Acinetobacter qingfengensis]|uniref:tRNA(Ile)-lysidine synthase n=2 Tax=Acinetobacter qingfengensis TaxID=1262585 RepID=A0A1E7RF16_9GAMM|nr:tRNA lysidine(34) synthetase TilS [Acinetobacter qingfengensis]
MDSMLLLYLLAELIPHRLSVISVDHQLQPLSQQWSLWVQQNCQKLNIPCQIIAVDLQQGNVEAAARQARYQALLQQLQYEDILVLAHHQQDQAETALLRLLQGTGVQGLAAMKRIEQRFQKNQLVENLQKERYWVWRPLLDLSRTRIEQWMQQLNQSYINDPMNQDQHYDRVWCRQSVWPVLEARFPKMQESIARCTILMQDAQEILLDVLQQDRQQCIDVYGRLQLLVYHQLSSARQRQLLSSWMQADLQYRPALAMVLRLQQEVIAAKEDAQAVLHYDGIYFVRFAAHLYRYSKSEWINFNTVPVEQTVQYHLEQRFKQASEQFHIQKADIGLSFALLQKTLLLKPRQGGEKIQLWGRSGHRMLKKMLQDAKIAPWQRHQTQILMYHNEVLGVFTSQGFWLADSIYVQSQGWLPQIDIGILGRMENDK